MTLSATSTFTLPEHLRLERSQPHTAPEAALRALAEFHDTMRAERVPQDPPLDIASLMAEMRHTTSDQEAHHWNVFDGERVVAHLGLYLPLQENAHLAWSDLAVGAPYRRQGIGHVLLRTASDFLRERGRTRLVGASSDRVPAGSDFARRMGAELALEMHTNQLDLADLDRALMQSWIDRAPEKAADYTLWFNVGAYPEDRLADIAAVSNVMNTAPRGNLDMEDWQITPERLREWEEQMRLSGDQRVSAFVEHRQSGQLVGYTELFWLPTRASILGQAATGVHPDHRRHGIGQWLKAANLLKAIELNPEARVVRTGNADSNQGMLAINHAMGFKPFMAREEWQIDTGALDTYLGERG